MSRGEKSTMTDAQGALDIPIDVYKEYEQGLCSITEREMELLRILLGIGEKPEVEVVEKKIVVEVPAEIPIKVCDIILDHIKDLQIDAEEQKKIWRYFRNRKLDAEERKLFG